MKQTVITKIEELVRTAMEINLDPKNLAQVFIEIAPHTSQLDVRIYPTGWFDTANPIDYPYSYYWCKDKQRHKPFYKQVDVQKYKEVMVALNDIKNRRT